jgi:hypothetical protein
MARLHVDAIQSKCSLGDIKKVVEMLPTELDAVYQEAMQRIDDQDRHNACTARKALSWIVYGRHTLSPSLLLEALAVKLNPPKGIVRDDPMDINVLMSLCAGLLVVDTQSDVVRLVRK